MCEDFMIDFAILSATHNKQEASQISGRVKGNIKHWKNYKIPIVFTTQPLIPLQRNGKQNQEN